MMLMFLFGGVIELLIYFVPYFWKLRRILVVLPLILTSVWLGLNLSEINGFTLILIIITIFRLLNLLKLSKNSVHQDYLKRNTRRTSIILFTATSGFLILKLIFVRPELTLVFESMALLQVIVALFILAITSKNLQKTNHHQTKHFYSDKELPTVTVAIPARNETNDLASCIRTVLANDYPKLEVLVLDDCSQDRTAEIIRDFAHDGVRFISGEPPADRWLAKNQAYEKLAKHASGEIILFCGVDVRFGPEAIRTLVSSMLTKDRSMMSVMPLRIGGGINTSLIQPLRYWWELALPRRLFNRPPVLSTCWLIKHKELKKLGFFKGVSHNIVPERFFARELIRNDQYAFIRADEHLDIKTVKPVEEQLSTAIRVKYPSLRKRPELVLLLSAGQLCFLLLPLIFAMSWFWTGASIVSILGVVASLLLVSTHYLIMSASQPFHSIVALVNYPFAIVTDIVLTITSMQQYEFGKIEWKGRNVCIPAMHVIKHFPII